MNGGELCKHMNSKPDPKEFNHAFVLMTALVPTVGHVNLVTFAGEVANHVTVIICSRSKEPTTFKQRADAFLGLPNVSVIHHDDDNAPQNEPEVPASKQAFWSYWRDTIVRHQAASSAANCCIVASETYGAKLASVCGFSFIPYDLGRSINASKGTTVRQNLIDQWDNMAPGFRRHLVSRVVLFGQESTGKTSLANALAKHLNGYFIPEWARPFLELKAVGPDVTPQKMRTIALAQSALEHHAEKHLTDKPFQFFDTDLVSTLGYMLFWDRSFDKTDMSATINSQIARLVPKDIYVVMNDAIPFEKDVLRYGGEVRETQRGFWIDVLNDLGLPFHVMKSTAPADQLAEAADLAMQIFQTKTFAIHSFERD
jgi:HTH-type transcriptional regulator, transcriptional repressor of NAD biosynthesis genes